MSEPLPTASMRDAVLKSVRGGLRVFPQFVRDALAARPPAELDARLKAAQIVFADLIAGASPTAKLQPDAEFDLIRVDLFEALVALADAYRGKPKLPAMLWAIVNRGMLETILIVVLMLQYSHDLSRSTDKWRFIIEQLNKGTDLPREHSDQFTLLALADLRKVPGEIIGRYVAIGDWAVANTPTGA